MTTYFMIRSMTTGDYPFVVKFQDERGNVIYTAEHTTSHESAIAYGKSQIRTQAAFNSLFSAVMFGDAREEIKFLELSGVA